MLLSHSIPSINRTIKEADIATLLSILCFKENKWVRVSLLQHNRQNESSTAFAFVKIMWVRALSLRKGNYFLDSTSNTTLAQTFPRLLLFCLYPLLSLT